MHTDDEAAPATEAHAAETEISRRRLLMSASGAVAAGLAGSVLAACGGGGSSSSSGAGKIGGTLQILGWGGYDDHTAAKPFLARYGVRTQLTPTSGVPTEWFTKLKAGAGHTTSLMTPNFVLTQTLAEAGLLEELDYGRLPSTRKYLPYITDVADRFRVNGKHYFAPYVWGDGPLLFNRSFIKQTPTSWRDVLKPEYRGKVALADDPTNNFWLWAKVLGIKQPNLLTKAQLAEVKSFLIKLKQTSVRTITGNWNDVADAMAAGDVWIVGSGGWEAVSAFAAKKGGDVGYTIPKEGTARWTDTWVIPKGAPNIDTAYAYIDWMLSAKAQAILAQNLVSATVNADAVALMTPSNAKIYPYRDATALSRLVPAQLPPLSPSGGVTSLDDWTQAWAEVKAA